MVRLARTYVEVRARTQWGMMSELSMAVSGGLPKDHILEMANGLGAGRKVRGRFEFMKYLLVALQIVV